MLDTVKINEYASMLYCHFFKGDNFIDFQLTSMGDKPFQNRITSQRKEFAPRSKFFP